MRQQAHLLNKKKYWDVEFTREFKQIIYVLENAKKEPSYRMIIGETGTGKTFTTQRFIKKYPKYTYCITVDKLFREKDIITELLTMLDLPFTGSWAMRNIAIAKKLREIKSYGDLPVLILDECENLSLSTLQLIKSLFDRIKNYCSIVLIGTPQLIEMLNKLKSRNKQGVPQFCRRFKAGTKVICTGCRDMNMFFEKHVSDLGLRRLLRALCDNYGELNDYLEPAIKRAEKDGVPLTEDYFRIMYDMPNP